MKPYRLKALLEVRRNFDPASLANVASPPAESPIPNQEEIMTETIVLAKEPAAKKEKLISTCAFAYSDLRSCAMPRWRAHSKYCLFHAHQAQQLLDARKLGVELATCTGEFRTNTDLNRALGSLFKAVAENRIPPRNAAVLAYIGQLLQKNIPKVQDEIDRIDGEKGLDKILADALDAHDGCTDEADDNKDATEALPEALPEPAPNQSEAPQA
jgi:hypothetical protein